MNRGLKVYKDNRKRGTVKLRGKIGTNIQRNRGIHGQKNGWKEKRRNIKTEGGPEDKPSPLHSISKRRSGLMLSPLDSGSRGPGSRGYGSRGPGSRGPGSRGPGSRPGIVLCSWAKHSHLTVPLYLEFSGKPDEMPRGGGWAKRTLPLFIVSVPDLAVVFTLAVIGLENTSGTTFSIKFPFKNVWFNLGKNLSFMIQRSRKTSLG